MNFDVMNYDIIELFCHMVLLAGSFPVRNMNDNNQLQDIIFSP